MATTSCAQTAADAARPPCPPRADAAKILKALDVLFRPEDVVELRAIYDGAKKRTDAGYFDSHHRRELAEAAAKLNGKGAAVYVTLNPVDPQLLGRYANRVQEFAKNTTGDADIVSRMWLLLDFDPVRPSGISATDAQLQAAKERALACAAHLRERGWPEPVFAMSGNGVHLLYRIDLPNDKDAAELVKRVLQALSERFDDDAVQVDKVVWNAARITKMYGTVAAKGDHTINTPWRLSHIGKDARPADPVPTEMLRAVAAECAVHAPGQSRPSDRPEGFDVGSFLDRLGIGYARDEHQGRERYKLERCPFNEAHGRGESAIFRSADGRLGFKCHHNSCADKRWRDVRVLVDGERETHRPAQVAVEREADHPRPMPLPKLPPVPAFPPEILPARARGWIEDAAERAQFPIDFMAAAAMVGLGSLIGRKAGIRLKSNDDWTEHGNVWGGIVGNPSALKSPAMKEGLRPLKRLQVRAAEEHGELHAKWAVAEDLHRARRDASRRRFARDLDKNPEAGDPEFEAPPEEPVARTFWTSDATAAKLGELAKQNPTGMLIERDELSGLLRSLEDERNADARGFYLSGWSGREGYRSDRIERGTTSIPAYALSVFGGIQPGPLARFVVGAQRGYHADGLMQRFQILVYPDLGGEFEYVNRRPNSVWRDEGYRLFEDVDAWAAAHLGTDGLTDEPAHVTLSPGAQGLFEEWYPDFMRIRRRAEADDLDTGPLAAHMGKFPGLLGKLALILHVCDEPEGLLVAERTVLKSLSWLQYLEQHAARVYHGAYAPETRTAELLLARARRRALPERFKAWEIVRNGWHGLTDRDAVKDGLALLERHAWVVDVSEADKGQKPGRPADPTYSLSPLAWEEWL